MPKRADLDVKKIKKAVAYASFKNMGHAGAVIRKVASGSIRKGAKPSTAGTPPHTRRGALKKSIIFAATTRSVIVGPSAQLVGASGQAHELGGEYRGERFQKRPFMVPALLRVRTQIPKIWRSSIKGV